MKSRARRTLPILLLGIGFIALQPAFAFEYPLSSGTIRDAYFLGKGPPDKRDAFFAKYTHTLPMPAAGPHISVVEIETPYSIVVTRAWAAVSNYFAPDAEEEFLGKPGVFEVRVQINLTASYGWQIEGEDGGVRARPDDFWKDFAIRLTQKQEVHPRAVRGQPIYDSDDNSVGAWLAGATLDVEYDPDSVDASAPATVDVLTPDGQDVRTTFDLAELR